MFILNFKYSCQFIQKHFEEVGKRCHQGISAWIVNVYVCIWLTVLKILFTGTVEPPYSKVYEYTKDKLQS